MGIFAKKIINPPISLQTPTPPPEPADEDEDPPSTTDQISSETDVAEVAIGVLMELDLRNGDPKELAKRAYDIAFAMLEETDKRDSQ